MPRFGPKDESDSRWPSIDPGALRHPISILSLAPASPVVYDNSGLVMSWTTLTTAMAYIQVMHGTDIIRAGQDVSKVWLDIYIRFQRGLDAQMRVQRINYMQFPVTTELYIIQAIENIEERNVLLRLTCLGIGKND